MHCAVSIGWKMGDCWDVKKKWELELWYATNGGWTADMALVHTWREKWMYSLA
jgi:hypothetical protein